ncbi:MAG TPA: NAD-dependent epimerase/dehydratase family protein [Solirubrobacteraceae bacterium]|nr:NAD-dependent epimerase/dehydratase family protein [Solirubrobacteraceae bacterium]
MANVRSLAALRDGPKRVLVTGGSGFIGRHLVSALSASGAHVRVLDLEPHPDPNIDIVLGDIAEPNVVERALDSRFDSVVHLAAVTSVLRSVEHPELTHRTNVTGTGLLLERARAIGVRSLAFASTNAVTGPTDAPAITEAAPLRPLTPYGSTKAAAEMLMSAYTAAYGLRCACLRFTNVYGPGMQAKDSIVARLMRAIQVGTTFEIYGDGRQVRDYVHVHDVVDALQRALGDERWSGPTVIGTGTSLSVLDVVDQARRVTGAPLPVRHCEAKAGEMPAVIVDPSLAHARGWSPRYAFTEGLAGVWEEWSGDVLGDDSRQLQQRAAGAAL